MNKHSLQCNQSSISKTSKKKDYYFPTCPEIKCDKKSILFFKIIIYNLLPAAVVLVGTGAGGRMTGHTSAEKK